MTGQDRQDLFKAVQRAVVERFPDVRAIYVFGSTAQGEAWPDSDLDVAILLPPRHPGWDRLAVISDLSLQLKREVDLIDLERANDVLRREILERGALIYVSDADSVLAWEGSAMTRYQHYREEVRDLLEDFERTGVGYGR